MNKNFCPAIENIQSEFTLKNTYAEKIDRESFSIEISKCNSQVHDNCKPDDEIEELLSYFMFTLY